MELHHNGRDGVVIVGGGLAAQRCAQALRSNGHDGPIRMVCAERHRPYDRPPLSKELLEPGANGAAPAFRPAEWYERHSIDLLLGTSATALNPSEHRIRLSDGSSLSYDWLLIATGSRPRPFPMLEGYQNVSSLRTLDDSRYLREVLSCKQSLAVIGAGFIGQEVAAAARRLGLDVTMIEAAACPLLGVLGPSLGAWFTGLHRSEGVEVLTGCTTDAVVGNGSVQALRLSNGRTVPADHVVVGVGVEPDIAWLAGSGLDTPMGVLVDPDGRTAADRVLCAGDAAATFDPLLGAHLPGSHWEAAAYQGARAARVMLELDPGPVPLTSFWTDQYGTRIQYMGHAKLADSVELDGDLDGRNFSATFYRSGRAVGGLLVNRPRSLPALRTLIQKGT